MIWAEGSCPLFSLWVQLGGRPACVRPPPPTGSLPPRCPGSGVRGTALLTEGRWGPALEGAQACEGGPHPWGGGVRS